MQARCVFAWALAACLAAACGGKTEPAGSSLPGDGGTDSSAKGGAAGGAGLGGSGGTVQPGGAGGSAGWSSCDRPGVCELAPVSGCCGGCTPSSADLVAVQYTQYDAYMQSVCAQWPVDCAPCPEPWNPNLAAFCEGGACSVVEVHTHAVSGCSSDADCALHTSECCPVCNPSPHQVIALNHNGVATYQAQRCNPDVDWACDDCLPQFPEELAAACIAGHCRVVASSSGCPGCGALESCYAGQLCVATPVTLPDGFTIDSTEVTRSQYAAWLATAPGASGQSEACAWNTAFAPDAACMNNPSVCQGSGCGAHPQVCIDLCDAQAYCKAVGKRLCGRIGSAEPVTLEDDPAQSQWFHACSSGGVNSFAYGSSPQQGACNDYLSMSTTTVLAGSLDTCQSPTPGFGGVFDLLGNVWEWEDNCAPIAGDAGAGDVCNPRGFSFGMGAAMPMCAGDDYAQRSEVRDNLGFRCCSL